MSSAMNDSREPRSVLWQRIMNATKALKELASEDQWQEFVLVEEQRKALLQDFFSHLKEDEKTEQLVADVHEIIAVNQSLVSAMRSARDIVQEQLAMLQKSKMAITTYQRM